MLVINGKLDVADRLSVIDRLETDPPAPAQEVLIEQRAVEAFDDVVTRCIPHPDPLRTLASEAMTPAPSSIQPRPGRGRMPLLGRSRPYRSP